MKDPFASACCNLDCLFCPATPHFSSLMRSMFGGIGQCPGRGCRGARRRLQLQVVATVTVTSPSGSRVTSGHAVLPIWHSQYWMEAMFLTIALHAVSSSRESSSRKQLSGQAEWAEQRLFPGRCSSGKAQVRAARVTPGHRRLHVVSVPVDQGGIVWGEVLAGLLPAFSGYPSVRHDDSLGPAYPFYERGVWSWRFPSSQRMFAWPGIAVLQAQ